MLVNKLKKLNTPGFQNNLWTLLSAGAAAAHTSLLLLIIVRFVGLAEAGLLSYAIAVSALLIVLVLFSVRGYQSTDIRQEYRFSVYLGMRTCTATIASIIMVVFLLLGSFDLSEAAVIFIHFLIVLTDGYADVFMGDLQQKGKMRIAGRMRVCAFCAAFIASAVLIVILRSIIIPLLVSGLTFLCVYISWIWIYRKDFGKIRVKLDVSAIKSLMGTTFPLVLGALMFAFLGNAQKYYLEALDSHEAVAIFTILIMPVNMLNIFYGAFFGGADITKAAELFAAGQLEQFAKRINRQVLFAVALYLVFMICAYFWGIPVLSWLYATELSQYRWEFMLLLFGFISTTVMYAMSAGLLVMRRQKISIACVVAVTVVAGPAMWVLVSRYGLTGAAYSGIVIYVPLAVLLFLAYRIVLRKYKKGAG